MMRYSALLQSRLGTPLSSWHGKYKSDLAVSLGKSFLYKFSFTKCSLYVLTTLCLTLTGCDSGSAASSVGIDTRANHNTANISSKNAVVSEQQSVASLRASDTSDANESSSKEDSSGQSLMSIARTDAAVQRTPMISAPGTDSTLQATLIGDYKGMLPCKSCAGINMTLNLLSDGSVIKTSIYENPVTPTTPLIESGVYRQDDNTIIAVYDNKHIEMYRIENNHLIMLDEHKNPNPDYTLSRK